MALTDIADRLTPSVPIEQTFSAQPIAAGTKIVTLLGHRAAVGGNGQDYEAYQVVNIADPVKVKAEVDALAGAGSEIGAMAAAFVKANSAAGRSNFPALRVLLIATGQSGFGPNDEALETLKGFRSDNVVSCYAAGDAIHRQKLLDLRSFISGPDRDLAGQFGTFAWFGSLDALSTAVLYNINDRGGLVPFLPDSNTALVNVTGDVTQGSNVVANVVTTGVYPGAQVSGLRVPAGALVGVVSGGSFTLVNANGDDMVATATGAAEALAVQNMVSQSAAVVAAAQCGTVASFGQPYNPVQGVTVGGLIPPRKRSDWIQIDPFGASEQALVAGLSPMYIQPGNKVGLIRTRTTLTKLPDGVTAVTDYFDYQQLVPLNDYREELYQVSQQPPFSNNPGGTKASVNVANNFNDESIRLAKEFEKLGMFQNVSILAKFFQTQPSTSSRGRFDCRFPVDVIPNLSVLAVNILAVSDAANFTI